MHIGFAKNEDKTAIRDLWSYCFDDSTEYNDYYFKNIFKPGNTIVAKVEGKLVGSIQMRKYNMRLFNESHNVALLVGISTLPEYRGLHIMHDLMHYVFQYLRKANYSLVFLTAKYPSFYKNYGFKFIASHKNYYIPLENIPKYEMPSNISINSITREDYNLLTDLYKEFHLDRKIYFERDATLFKQMHEELKVENGNIYLIKRDNKAIGYFFSILSKKDLSIREFIYKDRTAIDAFFSYLYYHQGQVSHVAITSPKDEMFEEIINWNVECKAKIKPFMLGRILDINIFSNLFEFKNLSVKISDNIIEENSVNFNKNSLGVIDMDISKLSQLLFNYIDVETFMKYNQIYLDNFKFLENKITPFLNQYI